MTLAESFGFNPPELCIAVDPGPTDSAFVVWTGKRITKLGKITNGQLRAQLAVMGRRQGVPEQPGHLAIEYTKSYLLPNKSTGRPFFPEQILETALESGRFIQAWDGPFHLVDRRTVKLHLIGRASCGDPEVRAALVDQIGVKGTRKNPGPTFGCSGDIWAALAVAKTYADQGCKGCRGCAVPMEPEE